MNAALELAQSIRPETVSRCCLSVKTRRNYVIGTSRFCDAYRKVMSDWKGYELSTSQIMDRLRQAGWDGGEGAAINLHAALRKDLAAGRLARTREGKYAFWKIN